MVNTEIGCGLSSSSYPGEAKSKRKGQIMTKLVEQRGCLWKQTEYLDISPCVCNGVTA